MHPGKEYGGQVFLRERRSKYALIVVHYIRLTSETRRDIDKFARLQAARGREERVGSSGAPATKRGLRRTSN